MVPVMEGSGFLMNFDIAAPNIRRTIIGRAVENNISRNHYLIPGFAVLCPPSVSIEIAEE